MKHPPEEGSGGTPEPPEGAADKRHDQTPEQKPVNGDLSAEEPAPHQPNDVNRPVQLSIPGLDVDAGEDIDDIQWSADAEAALGELTASGRQFTADDLRKRVGVPGQRNRIGTTFMIAAVRGEIMLEGFRHSDARSRHRGVQRVWRGAA